MRISWHALAVSAYCSLMVTSGFTTIKLPVSLATPVASAEAAATRQVQLGIQSLGFAAPSITLPAAPEAVVRSNLQPAAAATPSDELVVWSDWILANGRKTRIPWQIAQKLGLSNEDLIVKSTKTYTGDILVGMHVTEVLGRRQFLFTTLGSSKTNATFCLVGLDGVVETALGADNGTYWDIPADEGRRMVENARAFWRKQLAGIGNS